MKKKRLTLVLVLVLVLSLMAGCTGGGTSSDGGNSSGSSVTSDSGDGGSSGAESTGLFTDEIEENATILYWEMQWGSTADYQQVVQTLVDRFNSDNEYGITVEMEMILDRPRLGHRAGCRGDAAARGRADEDRHLSLIHIWARPGRRWDSRRRLF